MSWYDTDGELSENILFSKFTYMRSIPTHAANNTGANSMQNVTERIEALLKKNGFHSQKLKKDDRIATAALCERLYINADLCTRYGDGEIFFNEPCNLCITVSSSGLINIYSMLSGDSIRDAHKISSSAESLLDSELDFEYDAGIGYLCPSPHLCGSGIRISCALYLPLLTRADKISSICHSLSEYGVSLYPLLPWRTSGDIYVMTLSPDNHVSEQISVDIFEWLMREIVRLERDEVGTLSDDQVLTIAERAARALGILTHAGSICEEEMISLLSEVRLCLSTGQGDRLFRVVSPSSLNVIMLENMSAGVMQSAGREIKSKQALNSQRAASVREAILLLGERQTVQST